MLQVLNQGRLMRQSPLIFGLLFLALMAKPAASQSPVKRFSKGDALRLTIWQPWQIGDGKSQGIDINGDYLIDNRGYVFFPLIGEIQVITHNPKTLSQELQEKLSAYMQEPIVIVDPLIRVTLLGAFRRPGTYLIKPDASLWELVDLAEGPDDNSDLKKMYVERAGREIRKSLLSGFERAYTLQELDIRSGDQILLPERKSFTVKDAFEILRFGVTLLNVYFLVDRIND